MYVVSSKIIQVVSRGSLHVNLPAGWLLLQSFQILLAPCLHVPRLFLFKAFQPSLVIYPHTLVLETLKLWSWNFFTFLSCRIITHNFIPTSFVITFLTDLNKKKNSHPFLCFSSKVFTFDHLFTYIVQTCSTVKQFLWLNGQKTIKLHIDAWA